MKLLEHLQVTADILIRLNGVKPLTWAAVIIIMILLGGYK